MQGWYLIRGGYQYGPYSAQDLLGMLGAGGLYPQDEFLDTKSGRRYPIDKAIKKWRKTAGLRPKKRHTGLIVLGVIVLLIGGFISYRILTKTSTNLVLGSATAVAAETVSAGGGSITVSSGALDGFSIVVPEGAYAKDTPFKISTRPIEENNLGSLFEPVTPLISIDNGHAFAQESMTVTVPIEKSDDEFVMCFYYDEKSGKLEGIPVISESNSAITLLTNHFSDIVGTKVKLADLQDLSIDTSFVPGYDDWQFTNYGSYIAQAGHCAGQSFSAMWYFEEMYDGRHYPRLFGLYDDYGYGAVTRDFWQDDSDAYRFASAIQEKLNWGYINNELKKKFATNQDMLTMNAFLYAMALTDQPQFVGIIGQATAADGSVSNAGHAIIAYKVENGCLYVADPNYPGSDVRYIQFNGASFDPYSSGTNAAEIEAGNDIAFTKFYYMGQSALIDYDVIAGEFDKLDQSTSGDDLFPSYNLQLLTAIDKNGNSTWIDCPEEIQVDSAENVKNMGEFYRNKISICVTTQYKDLTVSLYKGLNDAQVVETKVSDGNGQAVFNIPLDEGINDIGFYVYYPQSGGDNYIGFTRVRVDYDLSADMKFEKSGYEVLCKTEADFAVKVQNAPSDAIYLWDFGDGSTSETEEPKVTYTYDTGGDYTITCTLVKESDGKILAEARADVRAVDVFGTWNMNYTITEAGAVNYIANLFGDMILGFFKQMFPDQGVPDSANIRIEGTVVTGKLNVYLPEDPGNVDIGKIYVELVQETSSTDFVDVETTPIAGYMSIKKDSVKIVFTGDAVQSEGSGGALTFEGTLFNGAINGTFSASGIMSGDFTSSK